MNESPFAHAGLALSVIVIAPDGYDQIATTVRHLRAQTIASRLELVVVAPSADRVSVPVHDSVAFGRVTLVGVAEIRSLAEARAVGVHAASAPIIAFAEDHSFPEPGWAAALIAAHERGYAGVSPEMKNGNPASALSWAAMFLHFGGAVEPEERRETNFPAAGHNTSYRRDVLLETGGELGERLLAEMFLGEALRARGHRICVDPAAVTRHVNMSRLRPMLAHAWFGGRLYGGLRYGFGHWSLPRRVVYAGGWVLIPLLRLSRVVPLMWRTRSGRRALPRSLPAMIAILVVHAAGEAAGYLVGLGDTRTTYSAFESRRQRYVKPAERALWV